MMLPEDATPIPQTDERKLGDNSVRDSAAN